MPAGLGVYDAHAEHSERHAFQPSRATVSDRRLHQVPGTAATCFFAVLVAVAIAARNMDGIAHFLISVAHSFRTRQSIFPASLEPGNLVGIRCNGAVG